MGGSCSVALSRDHGATNLNNHHDHLVNKEVKGTDGQIQPWHIAMKIIHSLPPTMHTLQTILIKGALTSTTTNWDLAALKLCVVADECQAHSTGEAIGTKTDISHQPNALAAKGGSQKMKQRDPNDLTWLS